tara:strand:+ start:417965 stop:420049 length:2085 start_codon:yes stop_codon:yes gene_type:complete
MKKLLLFVLTLFTVQQTFTQEDTYPVYKGCENQQDTSLENCFNQQLTADVLDRFKVPEKVIIDDYKGVITIVFLVKKDGAFEVLYVRSAYKELEEEARSVFANLPKAQPATYNGRPIDMRFGMPIHIPLDTQPAPQTVPKATQEQQIVLVPTTNTTKKDINTAINSTPFPEHQSQLNIPFTHSAYAELDYYYNKGENAHTASKPYVYTDAANYVNLDALKTPLFKNKTSKAGKKLWNEHFFTVQTEDYWFTINPMFDLQIGKDNSDVNYTYNNTRAIQVQGGLGKGFNFSASFYESQGRFADYINDFARANKPSGASSFGLVPGRGKGKDFKNTGFDYPVAEAYLSYTPNQFFNFQFGHGKNFIGDGYRSFMLSDVASPYPFLKINTQFWKIKYSNTWMWLDDVRPEVISNGASARKFVAMHHLSWNVNKRLNVGLFEAVVTNNENKDGFDVNFFNPVIFYRAVEFTKGSGAGNALIGLNAKYKLTDNITTYSQFVLDELTVGEFFGGDGYWGNKFALQLGAKYYNAFNIENLYLQGEFNMARPYTYAHENPTLNYAHFNQPLGHLWGSNFWEAVGIARYKKGRWFGNAKIVLGKKGFDFENSSTGYGGDVYTSNDTRTGNTGVDLLQGNKTAIFIGDLQGGYIVNPTTNLQFFGGLTFRNFDPIAETANFSKQNTTWFTIGLKTDIFNWYFDF